jgi:hypothetical protein
LGGFRSTLSLLHPFIPIVFGDSFRELVGLVSTGTQFKDRILRQRPGPEKACDIHQAMEDFYPFVWGIDINPEQRFPAGSKRSIGRAHLVHVLSNGGRMERRIALGQGEAVDLASVGCQGKLREFKHGKLAKPYCRAVLEFNLGKAAFRSRKFETFLDRGVHRGFSPIGKVRPLDCDIALDKTKANNTRVRIGLAPGGDNPQKNCRTQPRPNPCCRLLRGCHGLPPHHPHHTPV